MKQILYDTVSQTMVNRAVHSKERREKCLFMNNIWKSRTQWSILLTNLAKSDPIKKNIEQWWDIARKFFCLRGGLKWHRGGGISTFWDGGQAFMGGGDYPLMDVGSHAPPPHIGQPCSNSFLDSRSSLIVRQSKLSQLPPINGEGFGEGKGGGHYWKNILFAFYMFQSI